jgi:Fe-S cluster assembly ATP-binding protein
MSDAPLLSIDDLHASAGGVPILRGVSLAIRRGETHALMGPNGSGKSTLGNVLMGHPGYEITRGTVTYQGQDATHWTPDERGRAGMFLAFQYPEEIPGVTVVNFLRAALSNRTGTKFTVLELRLKVADTMRALGMDSGFADRYLNEGFSGGERKRNEVLQMAVLEPELAIMDETDSPERGFLVITHYQRLLEHITPDVVHVFVDGRIVDTAGPELARRIELEGYDSFRSGSGS